MMLDKELQYSDSQAVTGTVVSTNVIDHGQTPSGLGAGKEMMIALFLEAQTNATAAITVNVQTSDAEGFGSGVVTLATKVIGTTEIVAGSKFSIPLAPDYKALRYTRIQYVAGASSATISTFLAPQGMQSQWFAAKTAVTSI